jgi:hypothetical protein
VAALSGGAVESFQGGEDDPAVRSVGRDLPGLGEGGLERGADLKAVLIFSEKILS